MPSRGDVETLQAANRGLVALARRDLQAFWSSLDLTHPERARDLLLEFMPRLVEQYGEVAASVAADWYDDLRAASSAPGRYRAQMAALPERAAVEGTVRYAAGHLFDGDAARTLAYLVGETSRLVLKAGRDTVVRSAASDPVRTGWARVPSGADTCGFCLVMASRGVVYLSQESAGQAATYHSDCDCVPTPVWPGDSLPDGYDPDALRERYEEAAAEAGTTSIKDVLAAMRQTQGVR